MNWSRACSGGSDSFVNEMGWQGLSLPSAPRPGDGGGDGSGGCPRIGRSVTTAQRMQKGLVGCGRLGKNGEMPTTCSGVATLDDGRAYFENLNINLKPDDLGFIQQHDNAGLYKVKKFKQMCRLWVDICRGVNNAAGLRYTVFSKARRILE